MEIRMGPYECGFCNEYETTVIFEAYESLLHDLIWDLVYVGSPTHSTFDQLLMSVNYGTAERGEHKFLMEVHHIQKIFLLVTDNIHWCSSPFRNS